MNSTTRHEVLEKLHKMAKFADLKSNRERVEFFLDHVMDFKQIKSAIRVNIEQAKQKNSKSLSLAKNYKIEADMHMIQASLGSMEERESHLQNALKSYGKAILYQPLYSDLDFMSKLYLRKAQVHYQMKEYEAALYAIDVAIDIYYLSKSTNLEAQSISASALIEYSIFKANCLKMLQSYEKGVELLGSLLNDDQLSKAVESQESTIVNMRDNLQTLSDKEGSNADSDSKPEEYYSYKIDDRCQIVNSPIVGRHFVAKEDIEEGSVLLQERPYSIIIETEYLHKKCSNCYKELNYKFFPCAHCTELAFCDRQCFENSYEMFHRYECGYVSVLKNITSPSFHVFRMISRIGPIDAYNTEETKQNYSIDIYMKENNQRTVPELQKSHEEKLRAYKMSSILWDHNSKHSLQANIHHTIIGMEVAVLLDLVHDFFKQNDNEFMLSFIDMIIVDTRRIIFNVFGWHEYNEDWTLRGHVANCQCLVGSLINHSCVPNTNWEFNNGQIRFVTNRLIKQNEEITITYGPNKDIAYKRRQERLNHYYFACNCKVCVEDSKKGFALKCRSCAGPVPFSSPVNDEPALNGQCLLCFTKYPGFEKCVADFYKYQQAVNVLDKLSSINSDNHDLLNMSTSCAKKLVDLFITPNPIINKSVLGLSTIIEKYQNEPVEELIEMGFLVDDNLLLDIPLDEIKHNTLTNMLFWLKTFMKYIADKGFKSRSEAQAECKTWNTMLRFHYRVKEIIQELMKIDSNHFLKLAMNKKLMDCQKLVDLHKNEYGEHLNFV